MTRKVGQIRGNAGKGRAKGTPNKITVAARQAFSLAFEGIGGVPALTDWGKSHRGEFYKLYARMIPTEITGAGGSALIPGLDADYVRSKLAAGIAAALTAAGTGKPD